MITVRNADNAHSIAARAGAAGLRPGMVVKFAQGAASGDQPTVVKAVAADMSDATVLKGIVDFVQHDSQFVDFTVNQVTQVLTAVDDTIANGEQVNVWMGKIVIAYHDADLPTLLKSATVRESAKVAFDADTSFPAEYLTGQTDGRQVATGMVYRVDGPEVTLLLNV
jgi:hypothetical protein